VINPSEGGAKLTNVITKQIEIAMRSHPGPRQVYVIMFGGNNMRKTTKPVLEVAKLVSRFRRIMAEAQKANVRVLLCGDIPDPRPAVDSRLKLLDEALKDLEMGEGNQFIALRGSLLDAQGVVRKDIFKPRGDIHLNALGTKIVSLRIQQMLKTMLPNLVPVQAPVPSSAPAQIQTPLAPVQTPPTKPQRARVQAPVSDPAPVAVNKPPVVGAPLVAVVNAPAVAQAPAGVQQLIGQVQDLVIQHVTVTDQDQVETSMEVEDEDSILQRLFFKKYGRALPDETEKEKESDVDKIKFVIDLTDEDEMEVATSNNVQAVAVVKTEPIEINSDPNASAAAKVIADRKERRELVKARKALVAFGKTLRKSEVIPEKEAPLAAGNVIADTDSNVSEANSVNPVGPVNVVESLTTDEAIEMAEAAIAESDAAVNQKVMDEFDDESEFRLYRSEDDVIEDDDDDMIDDV
jgi:hypothetical protein